MLISPFDFGFRFSVYNVTLEFHRLSSVNVDIAQTGQHYGLLASYTQQSATSPVDAIETIIIIM